MHTRERELNFCWVGEGAGCLIRTMRTTTKQIIIEVTTEFSSVQGFLEWPK